MNFVLPLTFFSTCAGMFGGMDQGSAQGIDTFLVLEERHPGSGALRQTAGDSGASGDRRPDDRPTRERGREGALGAVRAGLADAAVVVPAGFGDARGSFGPPPFEAARFEVPGGSAKITIRVR